MSASGNSFVLNSVDYGDAARNLYVTNYDYSASADPRVDTEELADADGVVSWGDKKGAKLFILKCWVVGTITDDVESKMNSIRTAWEAAHATGLSTFILDLQPSRSYEARPISGIKTKTQGITGNEIELKLLVTDGVES